MFALVVQVLTDNCTFAGFGRWKIRVVYCVSGGPGDDCPLATNCDVHQQHQSASRVSACGGESGYSLHIIYRDVTRC